MYAVHPDEEWLGDPQQGTFEQGNGVATQQLQNPNVTLAGAKAPAAGSFQKLLMVLGVAFAILVGLAFIHRQHADEYKRVRIGLENWFVVGLMAATWIFIFKTGVTATANAPAPVKQFFGAL